MMINLSQVCRSWIFDMAGLGVMLMAELELLRFFGMGSWMLLCGRPAGTFEVDMDEEF